MTPSESITALDDGLSIAGEDITLRRTIGAGNSRINVDVECKAKVIGQSDDQELAGTVDQNELYCVMSPTQINAKQWPGGLPWTTRPGLDPRIPNSSRGDLAFVRGAWRAVKWAVGEYPQGTLVRINMRVMG